MDYSKIKVKRHPKFEQLYERPEGIELIIMIGGRGGMKSYEASKFAAYDATINRRRVAILRDEKEAIRESILQEIFNRYDTANKYGHFDTVYDRLENGIRERATGNMLVFTKGFRASSLEKRTNLKGVSDTDTAIIEEAEDIRDFNKFSTFKDSIRTRQRLIIVILNTPDIQHWIIKRYFNLEPITAADVPELKDLGAHEIDGYWKLIPKKIDGFLCIQTNWTDNVHLPEGVVRDYAAYGDRESPMYDLHYYLTAIKGFASSGRKGQIITHAKPIKLDEYLKLEYEETHGLDFGTSSPAGIVGVKFHKDNMYVRQRNYTKSSTLGLGKKLYELGLRDDDLIIADSAEPTSIGTLRRGWDISELEPDDAQAYPQLLRGYNIRGCVKGAGSINAGLAVLKGFNLFVCEESTDLWNEIYNYIYAQNKAGEYTNEPVDDYNHLIDPMRYVAQARGRLF